MEIYQDLLGMEFVRLDNAPTWHEDVIAYKALDKETGFLLGHFYLDLHPRDFKQAHAKVFGVLPRAIIDG